jgi:hypothetical protein
VDFSGYVVAPHKPERVLRLLASRQVEAVVAGRPLGHARDR